jgi:hypothetical protein
MHRLAGARHVALGAAGPVIQAPTTREFALPSGTLSRLDDPKLLTFRSPRAPPSI